MKQLLLDHPWPVEHYASMEDTMLGGERFVHRWVPSRVRPWASLTIVHGLGDHGGRFDSIAVSLASSGVGVLAIDLPGHGRSPGRRGIISSYDALLDEVGNSVGLASNTWDETPSFVLGHSMGGNLVLNWAIRRRFEANSIQGLVAMSPMLRMAKTPKPQFLRAGRWLAQKWPNYRMNARHDVRQLCGDPSGQDAYLRDPYVHRKVSLRLGFSLIESGEYAMGHAEQILKPCLLMHGTDDTLACPYATEELAARAGRNVAIKLWSYCRHDLHFELQRETIVTYLLSWIKQHASSSVKHHHGNLQAAA